MVGVMRNSHVLVMVASVRAGLRCSGGPLGQTEFQVNLKLGLTQEYTPARRLEVTPCPWLGPAKRTAVW